MQDNRGKKPSISAGDIFVVDFVHEGAIEGVKAFPKFLIISEDREYWKLKRGLQKFHCVALVRILADGDFMDRLAVVDPVFMRVHIVPEKREADVWRQALLARLDN
jgi:hypothetical protein